jgi:sugar phosphate isomerase/epimerase
MKKIKGPAIFLAQFLRDEPPFNSIESISQWAADLGYIGVQIPTWDPRAIDLNRAAESKSYCDDYLGMLKERGLEAVDLGSYLQGQVLAFHPAYAVGFSAFHPEGLSGTEVTDWAVDQLKKSVIAAKNLGIKNISVMSGGFLWHMIYPWPQRPDGIVEEAFTELASRWRQVLDFAKGNGITFGYELHPGSDLYDGATYEMFLDKVDNHESACITYDPSHFLLQQLDYLDFIKIYGSRIRAMHVKDAEFNPDGRVGVYGGYQSWVGRAGRFRSLGDGQVDFKRIFTLLVEAGYEGWAILEWECCIKSSDQGAAEGAPFIKNLLIDQTEVAFDDFAGGGSDRAKNRAMLGLD